MPASLDHISARMNTESFAPPDLRPTQSFCIPSSGTPRNVFSSSAMPLIASRSWNAIRPLRLSSRSRNARGPSSEMTGRRHSTGRSSTTWASIASMTDRASAICSESCVTRSVFGMQVHRKGQAADGIFCVACRNTTTKTCPKTSGERWATSPAASSPTSPPVFPIYSCMFTTPLPCILPMRPCFPLRSGYRKTRAESSPFPCNDFFR